MIRLLGLEVERRSEEITKRGRKEGREKEDKGMTGGKE